MRQGPLLVTAAMLLILSNLSMSAQPLSTTAAMPANAENVRRIQEQIDAAGIDAAAYFARHPDVGRRVLDIARTDISTMKRSRALSEQHSAYLAALIEIVGQIGDARAVDLLLDDFVFTQGNNAPRGIARFGSSVVNRMSRLYLNAPSDSVRISVLLTFKFMLKGRHLSPDTAEYRSVRGQLLRASGHANPLIRICSMQGMAALYTDPAAEAVMRRIARGDRHRITLDGRPVFPVRDAAVEALAELRSNR